ncbi:MAG: chemotaxis protein CheB [Planctomycetota bacterium]
MIRVLLVEDSEALAGAFQKMLESDGAIKVVGVARSAGQALDRARELRPDLIALDLRSPVEAAFAIIRRIMADAPTPIVVMTDLCSDSNGRQVALDAMTAGALTVLEKPDTNAGGRLADLTEALLSQVKLMSQVRLPPRRPAGEPSPPPRCMEKMRPHVIHFVGVAASTGGPQAVSRILEDLPGDFPCPVLLVQHISRGFLKDFADWLNSRTRLRVLLASPGEEPTPGTVYVAPEDFHLGLFPNRTLRLSASAPVRGHRPSATFLFASLAQVAPAESLGVLLTGMGEDGAEGLLKLKQSGGLTFAQDRGTSVVFGMPQAAIARGAVDRVIGLDHMALCMVEAVSHDGEKDLGRGR